MSHCEAPLLTFASLADIAKGEMRRPVRHSVGVQDGGGSLLV